MVGDHEYGAPEERSRRAFGLFRRRAADTPAGSRDSNSKREVIAERDKTPRSADAPASEGTAAAGHGSGVAASDGHPDGPMARGTEQEEMADRIVVGARLEAASLVAQGQTELMQARAEAADIQAEVRERLVEVIRREHAVAETESAVRDDPGLRSITDARHEAAEVVASARRAAIGLLEQAQQLLAASRGQTSSPPRPGADEMSPVSELEPRTGLDEPVVVVDLTTAERASRYSRQSAKLPKIGAEAVNALAEMRRLRESSKGRDA